jgi:hypothetical protein
MLGMLRGVTRTYSEHCAVQTGQQQGPRKWSLSPERVSRLLVSHASTFAALCSYKKLFRLLQIFGNQGDLAETRRSRPESRLWSYAHSFRHYSIQAGRLGWRCDGGSMVFCTWLTRIRD